MKSTEASRAVAERLRAAGIADAASEANLLTRAASNLDEVHFFLSPPLAEEDLERLDVLTNRRLLREPAAYITEEREFYGLNFRVSSDVLVPRPETELLVELALKHVAQTDATSVLDVGTGSGCVAVSLARHVGTTLTVTAVDASFAALSVARWNAAAHGVLVDFVRGDLASSIATAEIIVANLPYIPSLDIEDLEPEVRQWEPRSALDGGKHGLELISKLIRDCGNRLRPHLLALEVGFGQAAEVAEMVAVAGAVSDIHNDLAGIPRVVCARWS